MENKILCYSGYIIGQINEELEKTVSVIATFVNYRPTNNPSTNGQTLYNS